MLGIDDGIASGNANAADILFLIAAIVFFFAALVAFPRPHPSPGTPYHGFLVGLGLTLVAVAWLIL